jgi:hypothetical protein
VFQKHTKHTLFAVFSGWTVSVIAVVNTVKLLDAVLAQEQGTLCFWFLVQTLCCGHCVERFLG